MLGAFHKITVSIAPPQLAALFPVIGTVLEPFSQATFVDGGRATRASSTR